jgi:hypothetical protein
MVASTNAPLVLTYVLPSTVLPSGFRIETYELEIVTDDNLMLIRWFEPA